MTTDRRDFLKLATSGAAAAGILGAGSAASAATTATSAPALATAPSRPRGATPGTLDPEERRRLIGKAIFGPKEPAEGDGGMVISLYSDQGGIDSGTIRWERGDLLYREMRLQRHPPTLRLPLGKPEPTLPADRLEIFKPVERKTSDASSTKPRLEPPAPQQAAPCKDCHGSGRRTCPSCKGVGYRLNRGPGFFSRFPCDRCSASADRYYSVRSGATS